MPELAEFKKQFRFPEVTPEELKNLIILATELSNQLHNVFVRMEIGMDQLDQPLPRELTFAIRLMRFATNTVKLEFRHAMGEGPPLADRCIDPTGQDYFRMTSGGSARSE